MLASGARAWPPMLRGVWTLTVGLMSAVQPSRMLAGGRELASGCTHRQRLPGGFCSHFGGWQGEVSRVCCSWHWHLACSGDKECLRPAALVPWRTSSTPKPGQSGLESRPGTAGEVEAFWTVLGSAGLISAAGQGAALDASCPFSPGRSMKPSLFLFAFKDERLLCVKQDCDLKLPAVEDEHPWVAAGTR